MITLWVSKQSKIIPYEQIFPQVLLIRISQSECYFEFKILKIYDMIYLFQEFIYYVKLSTRIMIFYN